MAAKPLKGYKRIPGTAHKYRTPSGDVISEYRYRSIKARRVKGADGKAVFKNYAQQRRFRESQDFLRMRFDIRSLDSTELIDTGSDLEAAAFELTRESGVGRGGSLAQDARESARLAELLDAMGAPDYYFWRFWYSETTTGG